MMKNKGLFKHDIVLLFSGMTVCGVLCLTGCMKEEAAGSPSSQHGDGSLHFTATDKPDWHEISSRSGAGPASGYAGALKSESRDGSDTLYLHANVSEGINARTADLPASDVHTRSVPKTEDNFHNTIGLFGYLFSKTDGFSGQTPDFMYNVTAALSGNAGEDYVTPDRYYMPGGDMDVCFFGYSPVNWNTTESKNPFLSLPSRTDSGVPEFKYQLPLLAANQIDLCFSRKASPMENGNVPMTFDHAMTAILFVADPSLAGTVIHQISICGTYRKGTYIPDAAGSSAGKWSGLQGSVTCTIKEDKDMIPVEVAPGKETQINGDSYFFMLPQKFDGQHGSDNPRIEISLTMAGETGKTTRTISLKGQEWTQGTTVTYRLSRKADELEFNVEAVDPGSLTGIPYNGKNIQFNVLARKNDAEIPYVVEYSEDGKEWYPVWQSGAGTPDNESDMIGTVTRTAASGNFNFLQTLPVTETKVEYGNNSQKNLSEREPYGTESQPKNLADGTSANCYIVDRPGYYEIPAVCGNAWKNGNYNSDVIGKGFPDYQGNPITGSNAWLDVKSVQLLWQDVSGLVSNLGFTARNGRNYIRFHISKSRIAEGNAVIGALDANGKVMWSWHIWVADGLGTTTITGTDGGTRTVMDRPIGFVEGGSKKWVARNGKVRFRLTDSEAEGSASVFTFDLGQQEGPQVNSAGRYTLYQWGRKDPMLPIERREGNNIAAATLFTDGYDSHKSAMGSKLAEGEGVQAWINNPTRFNINNTIGNVLRSDLWNAAEGGLNDNTSDLNSVTKSMYDPSPKGYKIPPKCTFGGLIKDNKTYAIGLGSTYMKWYPAANAQYLLYTSKTSQATLTIPMSGLVRFTDNFAIKPGYYGISGFFWTAGKTDATHANQLYFSFAISEATATSDILGTTYSSPENRDIRNALPVIPVMD